VGSFHLDGEEAGGELPLGGVVGYALAAVPFAGAGAVGTVASVLAGCGTGHDELLVTGIGNMMIAGIPNGLYVGSG